MVSSFPNGTVLVERIDIIDINVWVSIDDGRHANLRASIGRRLFSMCFAAEGASGG